MTNYKQTTRKSRTVEQTGLLPAIPAIGSIALPSLSSAAGTIASAVGGTTIGSVLAKGLGKVPSAIARGASGLKKQGVKIFDDVGYGGAAGLAKAGIGTVALSKAVEFMNSGPEVGGVNILPVAAIGGIGILAASTVL